jgi:membrane-associated phospholipid phosphatase
MPLLATIYGESILRFMAELSTNPWWLGFWKAVAFFGDSAFFTIALPLIFAAMPWPKALRLATAFGVASFSSEWIKAVTMRPRPDPAAFGMDQGLEHFGEFESYAFPSGHTMTSSASWGWFAQHQPRTWIKFSSVGLVGLISVSRLALLRHDLLDIGAGLLMGLAVLLLLTMADRRVTPHLAKLPWVEQSMLWLLAGFVLSALAGIHSCYVIGGVVCGLGAGACWVGARSASRTPSWCLGLLRFALSLGGAAAARLLGGALLSEGSIAEFALYFVAGVWVGGIVPALSGGALVDASPTQ